MMPDKFCCKRTISSQ